MATVDASIPMQVQQPQFMTPMQAQTQLSSLRDLQAQSQIRQQQAQQGMMNLATQQKMSQWAAQPGNVDKLTGQATDQGMQSLSQFAPPELVQKVAISRQDFDKKHSDISKEAEQIQQAKVKMNLEKQNWLQSNVREPALIAYKEAKKNGFTEAAATAAGQREYTAGLNMGKQTGFFSEDETRQFNTEFDPAKVASRAQSFKEYSAAAEKTLADERADKSTKEKERHDRATEATAGRREDRIIGAIAKGQGMNENDVTTDERKLAVNQWIQNPSSMRGMDKTYQRNIIKWASDLGITAEDVQSGKAAQKFDLSSANTAGRRAGQMAVVEATIPKLVKNAEDASDKVSRASFVPYNKLLQMGEGSFSDPNLKDLKLANLALEAEYQQVISRGGSNVTALKAAMDALQTADSQGTYKRALRMVEKEVKANKEGTDEVRSGYGVGARDKLKTGSAAKKVDTVPNPMQSEQDKAAVAWAKANPNDPRAKAIMEHNRE